MKDKWDIEEELDNLEADSKDPFTQGWIEALNWSQGKSETEVQKKLDSFDIDGDEKQQGWMTALSWVVEELPIEGEEDLDEVEEDE